MLIYVISFFLVAEQFSYFHKSGLYGYFDAIDSLVVPWSNISFGQGGVFHTRFEWLALLLSGWINPVFLIATALELFGKQLRLFSPLKTAVILMIPFCWIVFYYEDDRPREGHFVWIAGMLIVLFSAKLSSMLARNERRSPARNSL